MSTETLPRDDTVTGLSTIEGIDLDLEVKCESSRGNGLHPSTDHPADVLTLFVCPCGHRGAKGRCWAAYRAIVSGLTWFICLGCGAGTRRPHLTVLEVLR